jgi:hypothetical protein
MTDLRLLTGAIVFLAVVVAGTAHTIAVRYDNTQRCLAAYQVLDGKAMIKPLSPSAQRALNYAMQVTNCSEREYQGRLVEHLKKVENR